MITGQGLAIILVAALTYFVGAAVVDGTKWVGHEAKRAGTAIVHVIKRVK